MRPVPMRKFHPYAVAAEAKGRKIYHLNIGQPDIETPKAYFEAVRHFDLPVLEYAPSRYAGAFIDAIGITMTSWTCTSTPVTSSSPTAARGTADRLQLHSRRRRQDPDSRAPSIPTTTPWCAPAARPSTPFPPAPTKAIATPTGPASRPRSMSTPGPSSAPTPAIPPAWC